MWDPETFRPGPLPGFDRLRVHPGYCPRRPCHGQIHDGATERPAGICWLVPLPDVPEQKPIEPGRSMAADVRMPNFFIAAHLCRKTYCFLMNTDFDQFGPQPGGKHVSDRWLTDVPRLLQPQCVDGPLFHPTRALRARSRIVPEIRTPVPHLGRGRLAADHPSTFFPPAGLRGKVLGNRYFTVFNDSSEPCEVTISWDPAIGQIRTVRDLLGQVNSGHRSREVLSGQQPVYQLSLRLGPEDVCSFSILPPDK